MMSLLAIPVVLVALLLSCSPPPSECNPTSPPTTENPTAPPTTQNPTDPPSSCP